MKYKYTISDGEIHIYPKMKKVKNGIRVYYSRLADERETSDYPVAYADTPKGNSVSWPLKDCTILGVNIKRLRFWGLFGYKWEVAEPLKLDHP